MGRAQGFEIYNGTLLCIPSDDHSKQGLIICTSNIWQRPISEFCLNEKGGRQGCLKSTIHASSALKSTFHTLSYTKSKSTHTKLKNEKGKPEYTTYKLDTFQCCHRSIFTVYFLSNFTQIQAWSHVQHFLATAMHYVLNSKRSQT